MPSTVRVFGDILPKGVPVSVGIDQSLTGFGFSAVSMDDPKQHLTEVYSSQYSGVQRLQDISDYIFGRFEALINNDNEVVDVAMEGTVLASPAALKLGELAGTVKLELWHFFENGMNFPVGKTPTHNRTPLQIPPMTLKKYATGKGTAKKQEMLLQIYKRYGVEFNDDNAADAYALARLAGKHAIDEMERAQVDKVHNDPKYRDSVF